MSHSSQNTCGDCHYLALKRHMSKCKKPCTTCDLFEREAYVCKNHVRDYCSNENIVGKIDRTYPACDEGFLLRGAPDPAMDDSPGIAVEEVPRHVFSWEIGARKWADTAGRPRKTRT